MKEFFKQGIMAFADKISVRFYEILILLIAGMCAGVGFTFTFVYYGNDIMAWLGLSPLNPFTVVVDNDLKTRALVMGIVGLVVSTVLLQIMAGKSRIVK